jgi:hypothetical protein
VAPEEPEDKGARRDVGETEDNSGSGGNSGNSGNSGPGSGRGGD